jgi:hypothetical protein
MEFLMPTNDKATIQDALASHLDTLLQVRGYCNAVLKTILTPTSNPPPSWFTSLTANLQTAQQHAAAWAGIEQDMVATVPQDLINYGNTFTATADDILANIPKNVTSITSAQLTEIQNDLTALQQSLPAQGTAYSAQYATFNSFAANVAADYQALASGVNSIATAMSVDEADIASIQSDIDSQNGEIAADRVAIEATGIATGVGIFAGVGIMALGVVTAGIGCFVGGFVLAGALASTGMLIDYETRLHSAQGQLQSDQDKLAGDKAQMVSLQLLNNSVSALTTASQNMAAALSAIGDWWSSEQGKLNAVIAAVNKAIDADAKDDLVKVRIQIGASQIAWNQLIQFATSYQTTAAGVQDVVVPAKQAVPA